ncbi:translesion error-prone DNA polymerase V autoproteolytic subunit [Azotobacter chroococcum]|uniref:SOS response UmuD protein, Serine peptidase, MEROPS family S24 n=1 Tax=Azotobacter chroococcum NCIMB 8003 TaxID=1328314 RepID=A0A0C4WV26_9GAMM|nr:translesion error-prone DNA polymerase V autoproteolytic subunit [Azotobacter chroococcum]AJE23800.1 SOS response UmuD protein, Serine peptidase, MEROPS family S24 [Azotobacter chroococcum NCIMB 8003]ASL28920.1 hypothetical protein ACG10_21750 [Azotobacter chroococcum]TBW34681.1 translesion error-prone DNA polymerase V autoproteolytic subunit [Azotobacter chroococcum]
MNASLIASLSQSLQPQPLLLGGQASCGFPSPAADYQVPDLSLDELVGIRPSSSIFLLRAWGESMQGAAIHDGDILVVDKARQAQPGDVVVAVIGPEFVVKRLALDEEGRPLLLAENTGYEPIRLGEDEPLEIWGVCIWVLHDLVGR